MAAVAELHPPVGRPLGVWSLLGWFVHLAAGRRRERSGLRLASRAGAAEPRERFQLLFEDHEADITAYVRRRSASISDAEDVVAETFTVVWRRLDDVPSGADARPWIFGVARNLLSNQRRSVSRRGELVAKVTGEVAVGGGATIDADPAEVHVITEALERLSDADREILELTAWEGLDRSEIAAVLGVSGNAVGLRLHRARQRFASHLDELDGPDDPGAASS